MMPGRKMLGMLAILFQLGAAMQGPTPPPAPKKPRKMTLQKFPDATLETLNVEFRDLLEKAHYTSEDAKGKKVFLHQFQHVAKNWGIYKSLAEFLAKTGGEEFNNIGHKEWETLSSLLKFIKKENETVFNKDTQWKTCNNLAKFRKENPGCKKFLNWETQWETCNQVLAYLKSDSYGIGDWVEDKKGKKYRITGIDNPKDRNGKLRFRFMKHISRDNTFEYTKVQRKGRGLTYTDLAMVGPEKGDLEKKYTQWKSSQDKLNGRRRRLLPMERLLRDINRAQRTA